MTSQIISSAAPRHGVPPHRKMHSLPLSIAVFVLFLSFLPISNTNGEIIEIDLPELTGSYSTDDILTRTAAFDLGQPVAEVHQAWIRWAGTITPGTGHGDGVERPSEEWFDWPSQVYAYMDTPDPGWWSAYFGPVGGSFQDTTLIEGRADPSWDFLRDGAGEVLVGLAPVIILGGIMVDSPVAQLDSVSLIFDLDFVTDVENTSTWGEIKSRYRRNSTSP